MKRFLKNKANKFLLVLFFAFWFAAQPAPAQGQLKVVIQKLRTSRGVVRVTLFTKEGDYMKNFSIAKTIPSGDGEISTYFENLAVGEFAITVMHDENNNGKLDSNFFGIPKEGIGFSNNAAATFGPPSWAKAKFKWENNGKVCLIALKYF